MASQSPAPPVPKEDIEIEESGAAGTDATPSKAQAAPVSTYLSGTTLKKRDFDIMTNLLQGIVNYRDPEYVVLVSRLDRGL